MSLPYAIRDASADDVKLLPVGTRTQQAYYACVRQLGEHFTGSPDRPN